ncbi:MAG: glutamate formimidoyltransferase [Elusimicrobia bacterium]|nr:glutamate formimidoyltransferase [Elusimicrobiota bacterium]
MSQLVECVPNFSEGRDKVKVEAIVAAARAVAGVRILDVETDGDHHRMVLTFVAPPDAAVEAAYRAAAKAKELIDLTQHKGEHPRMGASDVIPFIPVSGVGLAECVALAKRLGERIGAELGIPVFLYGYAAARPERKDLAAVRKGQFEGLRDAIGADPARDPDFGPRKIHPTAGATAVGAREQIINFNVNLDLTDLEVGKGIAKTIRTSGGGLPELRAKEIQLSSGKIQISTVLTNYRVTPISKVYDAIRREAAAHGSDPISTEIVGLLPRDGLVGYAVDALKVINFDPAKQVLETQLEALAFDWKQAGASLSQALADVGPTPGGGSAAAIAGAMACGLGQMAMGISLKSKKLEESKRPALVEADRGFGADRHRFLALASEDAAAFDGFMDAMKIPKEDPGRASKIAKAVEEAARVPLETARLSSAVHARLKETAPLALGTVGSDVNCALHLARAAALCAAENVRINLGSIKDPALAKRLEDDLAAILARV